MAQQLFFRAYTVIEREKQDPIWLNIGAAFLHKDDKGFNVVLQALPLDGKLVLRLYEEGADKPGGTGKKKPEALERS